MKNLRDTAFSNALSSVAKDKRLPNEVFVGHWEDYLFFEPYMMFDNGFVEVKNVLLRGENANVMAVVNLGNDGMPNENNPRAMFLELDTAPEEYISKLRGGESAMN